MNSTMTERDKKLLYMLGFIIIIFFFIIAFIRPLLRAINKNNEAIAEAQVVHDEIELKMERLPVLEAYKEKVSKKVDGYAKRYYEVMDSTKIDELLTGYVLGHGLKAVNLYIDMPKESEVLVAYINSDEWEEEVNNVSSSVSVTDEEYDAFGISSAPVIEDLNSLDDAVDEVMDTSRAGIYAATVTIDAYGTPENLQKLLDDLVANPSIRVTGFNWLETAGSGFSYVDGQLVELEEKDMQLQINLEVYMYDSGIEE